MMNARLTSVTILLAGLLGGGCASTRINVTPAAKQVAVPANNACCYALNDVRLSRDEQCQFPGEWEGSKFGARFATLAEERYPTLFQRTPGAIPLSAQVTIQQDISQGAALGVYLCTLCIVGGIFPSVPWETEWQVSVQVSDARGAPVASPKVHAIDRGWWTILTPLGLMEFPGESDAPKVSAVMRNGPGQMPVEHGTYTMQCAIDLLAADLLKQPAGSLPASAPVTVAGTREPAPLPLAPLPAEPAPVAY